MTRDWDAATYERVSDNQFRWGVETLDDLDLRGDEVVLDAGCGSGRVTHVLRDRLPQGRVIAVDAAPSMVARAREALGDDRVDYVVADLAELTLGEQVDAILSTAVFHWIPDHDRLFARMYALLRPGGRMRVQCGGEGNIASVRAVLGDLAGNEPWREHLGGWRGPWNFAGPGDTAARLERAGFAGVECWLTHKTLHSDEPEEFLRSVTLGVHLDRLPPDLHDPFVSAVAERLGDPLEIDYVRLNIRARKEPT